MEVIQRIFQTLKNQVTSTVAAVPQTIELVNRNINKVHLPPFNKDNVLFYYMPLQGLVSYTTLSISVMNPHLMVRLFPQKDITDVLFLSAGCGAGLWLWARPHMAAAAPARRFSWAFLGGCLWPLGSIFLWAILRSSVGQRPFIGTVIGVSTGLIFTNIALDYFNYIDLLFCGDLPNLQEAAYSPNSDDDKIFDNDL